MHLGYKEVLISAAKWSEQQPVNQQEAPTSVDWMKTREHHCPAELIAVGQAIRKAFYGDRAGTGRINRYLGPFFNTVITKQNLHS